MRKFLRSKIDTFRKNDKILVLIGIHGSTDGGFAKSPDPKLSMQFKYAFDNFKKQNKELLEVNNITLNDLLVEPSKGSLESQLMNELKEDYNALVLAFCYSDISKLNDVLRSEGYYADMFIRNDLQNIFEQRKFVKFDDTQKKVLKMFKSDKPNFVILFGHFGTGKTLLLVNMLQMRSSEKINDFTKDTISRNMKDLQIQDKTSEQMGRKSENHQKIRVIVTADIDSSKPCLLEELKENYMGFTDKRTEIDTMVKPLHSLLKELKITLFTDEDLITLEKIINDPAILEYQDVLDDNLPSKQVGLVKSKPLVKEPLSEGKESIKQEQEKALQKKAMDVEDNANERRKNKHVNLILDNGWLPKRKPSYPSINEVILEGINFDATNSIEIPQDILAELNSLTKFEEPITASWLQKELNDYILNETIVGISDQMATLRKYRQRVLLDIVSRWYLEKKDTSLVLNKLLENLSLDKHYHHTILMVDEFDGRQIPSINSLSGKRIFSYENVSLFLSIDSLTVPKKENQLKLERVTYSNSDRLQGIYCHLPTKYRVSYDNEVLITEALRADSQNNCSQFINELNRHPLCPKGSRPIWYNVGNMDLKESLPLLQNEILDYVSKEEYIKEVVVISKFKFPYYKNFCSNMDEKSKEYKISWKYYENSNDLIGTEIPCLLMFGIPFIFDWRALISRAKHKLIFVTGEKLPA